MRTFKKMMHQHRDRVFTFALYYLGQYEEAEDVTQEVFVRLWKYGDRVDAGKLEHWLITVTRNACFDALRRRKVYQAHVTSTDLSERDFAELADDADSPEQLTENSDFQEKLEHALAKIDDPYRSILILREIQDYKYEQIGDALDLPLNTVKAYLHRGRKMLREQLKCVWEDEKHI